jgi:hypothetical protein
MTKATLTLLAVVCLAFPVAAGASTPRPDPAPGSGHKSVTITGYTIVVPVKWTGSLKIRGSSTETCQVPARWHGKPNWMGHRRCALTVSWAFAPPATQ